MKRYHPKIELALRNMVNTDPFFACLLVNLDFVEDPTQPTQGTDGKRIFYNPTFWDEITQTQALFELAHEACHPMLGHLERGREVDPVTGKHYDPILFNAAGDYVINLMLLDAGFTVPQNALYDEHFRGWTTNQVYHYLYSNKHQNPGSCCNGGKGLMKPASDFSAAEQAQIIQQAAAVAKARGKLPATIAEAVKAASEPRYPLHLLLERFIDQSLRSEEMSWRRPHRDFLPRGIIMPSADIENRVSHVVIVYDTSGSVSSDELKYFHGLAGKVLRHLRPEKMTIIPCDAEVDVGNVQNFERPEQWPSSYRINGRGGTAFAPPFAYLAERNIRPSCLVYLTDLEGDFPTTVPPYPVLWVSTQGGDVPFGQVVTLPEGLR
jgi:predicted metal-dependent peptidase